ncbi:MAG TPA: AAA family ATPase [Gammaproteobacteria bacterium]|nr:AAA family ATPase [Gammaproteobacteria bacterium]
MLRDATLPELNAEFGPPRGASEATATIACLADIQSEPLRWLWPGRFPLGKLSILSGDPGLGKSLVTLAIAAAVSRGAPWPCHEGTATLGDVVLISAEDDAADTIRPRLEAAGADLKRVHVLEGVDQFTDSGDTVRRPWNFGDVKALDRLLAAKPDCRLVVVDPISAYLAGTDSHKNSDVRALLAPLADLAARHGVALLAVSHLNKSAGPAMYRTTGSLAFVAAARAAFAVAKDKDDLGRRLVLPIKCNLSPDSSGLAYRIGQSSNGAPVVEWETSPVTITADEALAVMNEHVEDRSQTDEAVDWLRVLLADGPRKAGEVQREARQAGISDKALRRARERLKVRPSKSGFSGAWTWTLPEDAQLAQGAHAPDVGIFEGEGILGAGTGCTADEYRHIKERE